MTYQHDLKHYCKVYEVSYRTILRYKKAGYPLDDESATRALIASQRRGKGVSIEDAPATLTIPASINAALGSLGLAASIGRLQTAEAQAHANYKAATGAEQARYLREWLSLSEQLRKVEQSTPDIQEANRKTVSLSDLTRTLNELFTTLRQDLDSVPKRIALELVGKDEIAIREILARENEEIISALYHCKFLSPDE